MNLRLSFSWLISGLVFGVGLTVSGMINPRKVLAFLDVAGAWDPTLLLVMLFAVASFALFSHLVLRRAQPWFDTAFSLPTAKDIDLSLVMGAAVFGLGWGLAGYCPGPAIAAFSVDLREPAVFVSAMIVGMLFRKAIAR